MSEFRPNPPVEVPSGIDGVSDLLRSAGRRPQIDPVIRTRVEQASRRAWQAQVARRQRRRWGIALAAGLGLFAVLAGVAEWTRQAVPPPAMVAQIERAEGVAWRIDAQGRSVLRSGDSLLAGDRIELASAARLALRAVSGASLRIDQRSRLRLEDAASLSLDAGAVYLDNHGIAGAWTIRTPLLEARDIGTRFMVTHGVHSGSSVRVRDGLVQVAHGDDAEVAAGERIDVDGDGNASRRIERGHGEDWDWVVHAAMPPDLRGRPVIEFLRWYAEESGLVLQVDTDQALALRLKAPLQGSTAGLGAADWLQVAQLAAEFRLRTDSDKGALHVQSTR